MRRRLEGTLPSAQLHVLLVLVKLWHDDGRATVRGVAAAAGISSSTAFAHLEHLRAKGYVGRDEGCTGTLRPLVDVVAHG